MFGQEIGIYIKMPLEFRKHSWFKFKRLKLNKIIQRRIGRMSYMMGIGLLSLIHTYLTFKGISKNVLWPTSGFMGRIKHPVQYPGK